LVFLFFKIKAENNKYPVGASNNGMGKSCLTGEKQIGVNRIKIIKKKLLLITNLKELKT
jgi:hypothetical protein